VTASAVVVAGWVLRTRAAVRSRSAGVGVGTWSPFGMTMPPGHQVRDGSRPRGTWLCHWSTGDFRPGRSVQNGLKEERARKASPQIAAAFTAPQGAREETRSEDGSGSPTQALHAIAVIASVGPATRPQRRRGDRNMVTLRADHTTRPRAAMRAENAIGRGDASVGGGRQGARIPLAGRVLPSGRGRRILRGRYRWPDGRHPGPGRIAGSRDPPC